jgi:thiol-disulfide isomerase/thioredoxin
VEKAETKAFGCTIERVRNHCEAGCHFSDWCSHALRGAPVAAHDEDAFGRTLAAKKSKVVLFDFWVTWRDPCRAELPELVKLERKWCGRGLVLVTAPADEPERETAALQFLVKRGVRFPALREARRE